MKEFLLSLADHLEAQLTLFAPVKIGSLDLEPKAISIRQAPAPAGVRYMNRSMIKNVTVQLLAKSESQGEVMDTMELMTQSLELSSGELTVTGYDFIKCGVYTEPNFVEKTSNNEYLYTALFQAELIKRG
jgi:hypothetical protein